MERYPGSRGRRQHRHHRSPRGGRSDHCSDDAPRRELVPSPLDTDVHDVVARTVAETAFRQGIAQADYVPYVDR